MKVDGRKRPGLKSGKNNPNYKGGHSHLRAYRIWFGMMRRCYKPSATDFKHYGARGIKVAREWHIFENFYANMGDPPDCQSIERVDNDGDYNKDNCVWADQKRQCSNTRRSVILTYNGQTFTLSEWARRLGIKRERLQYRLKEGWPMQYILSSRKWVPDNRGKIKFNQDAET